MKSSTFFVQFTHPGLEHTPDKKITDTCFWNSASKHRRKFICSDGQYIDETGKINESKLMFWGEWEPPSKVMELNQITTQYPKWLHFPFLDKTESWVQNTDPCVFGESFKYFLCRQYNNRGETQLASLEPGSIILFGSGKKSKNEYFKLDTVFVVGDYISYNSSNITSIKDKVSKEYYESIILKAWKETETNSLNLRLYLGATIDAPVNDMYSFSPAQLSENNKIGFPRVELMSKDFSDIGKNLVSDTLFRKYKRTPLDIDTLKEVWNRVRTKVKEQNCVEAIHFPYPLFKDGDK